MPYHMMKPRFPVGRTLATPGAIALGIDLAAYMRPLHYELLEPGQFPLNRVAKTDYVIRSETAKAIVKALREKGGWDR